MNNVFAQIRLGKRVIVEELLDLMNVAWTKAERFKQHRA